MQNDLATPVQYLKGVGPYAAKILRHVGINTIADLIYYFPRDWEDRGNIITISKIVRGNDCLIKGNIMQVWQDRTKKGFTLIKALVKDETSSVKAVWFNQQFLKKLFDNKIGSKILIAGKAEMNPYSGNLEITVKDYELLTDDSEIAKIVAKYPLTDGLYQKKIRNLIGHAIKNHLDKIKDPLPDYLMENYNLIPLKNAINGIHFPKDTQDIEFSRKRLAFDEFFMQQICMAIRRKEIREEADGISLDINNNAIAFFEKTLPFKLTSAQKRVIDALVSDMKNKKSMNRLIQGDVGSGKTIVAVFAAYAAVQCGYQAALMAPTEILAQQHFLKISSFLQKMNIRIEMLTGGMKKNEKEEVKRRILKNGPCVIVGTHALIQEGMNFSNLGLVIVDEQHRFGVSARAKLKQKGKNPELLVMTATPIPRTLSLTLYGDLDKSIIDEMPPGRTPVITRFVEEKNRLPLYGFMRKEIEAGRQAYVVCPMIEESEKMDLAAAKDTCEKLKKIFPEMKIGLLHGKMKSKEKEAVMDQFKKNLINILVSTTVIEVGIDVPNASIMLIEHSERFGLSALHQLRGRIGRGSDQSYCFLAGNLKTQESKARIRIMIETNDGFKIAEADLRLRGPGEILGLRQSGIPEFKVADIIMDEEILKDARKSAFSVILNDPMLGKKEHQKLKQEIINKFSNFLEEGSFN